jgi:hypothetical protein
MDIYEERLQESHTTTIPDLVALRCDLPGWLSTRSRRDRHIIRDLARSERTGDVAKKFRITPGRVSQLRRDYHDDWQRFCADPENDRTAECMSA